MSSHQILQDLTSISPRYGVDEVKAAVIITIALSSSNIPYIIEKFPTAVPRITKADFFADGQPIPCIGSSFSSGYVKKYYCSPHSDDISVISFYDEPSVTISRLNLDRVKAAKDIGGVVVVEKEDFTSKNILVGNISNPKSIIFAHYDSIIGPGAVDNATAVSIIFNIITSQPQLTKDNLFVFAGNEEISYDKYSYDGYGFRVFELLHSDILRSAGQIIAIDGVGVSTPEFVQTGLKDVLQLRMLEDIKSKVFWLQNNQSKVLEHYHSAGDVLDNIVPAYLKAAYQKLISRII